MEPSVVGTIARFEVTSPSTAFSVDTVGWFWPSGHNVRYPNLPDGITVALKTYACDVGPAPRYRGAYPAAGGPANTI